MKSAFFILILVATAFAPACSNQRQLIQPTPPPAALTTIQKPIPLRAVFYVSEKTKTFSYRSPDYIPWLIRPNYDMIRPFEIPVGLLFANAALQAFSEVFQAVTVVDNLPVAGTYPLLIEPSFENIYLDMVYFASDSRPPHNNLLDIEGLLEAKLRLTWKGQPDWHKNYRVSIPPQRILVNPWTGEQIAGMVADAVSSLVGAMAREMTGEADAPALPLDQWLKSLPQE